MQIVRKLWVFQSSPVMSFSSHFLPGSSDEDEDDDGVSAAAFLKKKPESSGDSRKFLKKMDVRSRVRLGDDLFPESIWVLGSRNLI